MIELEAYDYRNVQCLADRSPEPPPSNCAETLQTTFHQQWGVRKFRTDPPVNTNDVETPKMFIDCTFPFNP